MNIKTSYANVPQWKSVTVKSKMPKALQKLDELANNMWWTWNSDAYSLFHDINDKAFRKSSKNVVDMLSMLSYEELLGLGKG